MIQAQTGGMQCLAQQTKRRGAAVQVVGQQRVAARSQVNTDLVGAAAVQAAPYRADTGGKSQARHVGAGRLAPCHYGHSDARYRITAYRGFNRKRCCGDFAVRQGQVLAANLTCGNRARQAGHRGQGFGNHHQARCVLVEPVNNAGPRQLKSATVVRQQAVEQGAAPVSWGRMNDQTSRFGYHHEVLVFEADRERHRFSCERPGFICRLQRDADPLTRVQPLRSDRGDAAVDLHAIALDQALQIAARELTGMGHQQLVQPLAMALDPNREATHFCARIGLLIERADRGVVLGPNLIIALVFCSHAGGPFGAVYTMIRIQYSFVRSLSVTAIFGALLVLSACSSTPKDDPNSTAGVERLYADAKDDMASGSYDKAIKTLERVEGRAAGTLLAQQAVLDLAYAQYRTAERASALATLDRFVKQYPSSPALDYAFYLRGLVNFNDNLGILGSLAQQDLSERDQQASRDAYQSFKQLVTQFPQSRYADEGRGRMNYIVNALANYEVHVARYYLRRGAFLAAANRAQQVVLEYPQTPANEEALFIMQLSYERLGLEQLRTDTARVLQQNFPTSRFSAEGIRQSQRAWWRLW